MPELHDLLERRASRYEPPLDLFNRVLDRHRRRDRHRRVGTAVVALAVAAAAIGVLAEAFLSGPGPRPADQPSSRFVGTWTSPNLHAAGWSQTMTIRPAEDGTLHIALHDDSSWLCLDRQTQVHGVDTQSTLTGTGRLEGAITLVVPSFVLACSASDFPEEKGGTSYTLVLDLATDRLFDNLGMAWHRGATPENGADITTECGAGSPGTFSMFGGEVTFHADRPWSSGVDSCIDPRVFGLVGGPDDSGIEILANPLPPQAPCYSPRVPPSAEALVRAIRSSPDLEATTPVPDRVGGIDALRLDVAAVPGAATCPNGEVRVVPGWNGGWGTIAPGQRGRLYVLDLPGGSARTLAILIIAPEAAFERGVEAAAPILDSFEFYAG
jgi:hypothetical protein